MTLLGCSACLYLQHCLGIETQWMNNSSIKLFRIQLIEIVQCQILKKSYKIYFPPLFSTKLSILVIFYQNTLEIKVKLKSPTRNSGKNIKAWLNYILKTTMFQCSSFVGGRFQMFARNSGPKFFVGDLQLNPLAELLGLNWVRSGKPIWNPFYDVWNRYP